MLNDDVHITVINVEPQQTITIRALSTDADGTEFQSYATFIADEFGTVDLATMAPIDGSYHNVDAMGLFWSMDVAAPDTGTRDFRLRGLDAIETEFNVMSGDERITSRTLTRHRRADGVRIEEIDNGELYGRVYRPGPAGNYPAVIVLGGSEGGIDSALLTAELLSSRGYIAFALGYFSHDPMGSLPTELEEIPLECFGHAIEWLAARDDVDEDRIAIVGGSKGAEAALLVGSYIGGVAAVAAFSPPSVVWAAPFSYEDRSTWTLDGSPLPFVIYQRDPAYNPPSGFPNVLATHYRYSLANAANREAAAIPVEQMAASLLLVSGSDDQIWDSDAASRAIMSRLDDYGSPIEREHLAYQDAGHSFSAAQLPTTWLPGNDKRWPIGGSPEGNAIAGRTSWEALINFLDDM